MTHATALSALLACPRCDKTPLDRREALHACSGCKTEFPDLAKIPWLFAEPEAALGEWRARWHFALRSLHRVSEQLGRALEASEIRDATRARLERYRSAILDHIERLSAVLTPLDVREATAEYATYLALRTRLPPDQGLLTYYNNVHRDWAWGGDENSISCDIVRNAMSERSPARLLVLGAGSGRLAYDLHRGSTVELTVALDFNPLLALLGKDITAGREIELYEFPLAPRDSEHLAVLRRLCAEEPARAGLHFILADTHRPPLARASFDTVVTPWLIDIIPESFDDFSKRINGLLTEGGQWINFGSLSFHNADPTLNYSLDECLAVLEENGFTIEKTAEDNIPYMCSPASRHGRREEVVSWSAVKKQAVKKIPRYTALPEWIVRGNTPVPQSEAFRTQAMVTRIHAYIMSLIDGKRTLKDIADLVSGERLMTRAEAEPTIRSFLIKMYDEGRRMGD